MLAEYALRFALRKRKQERELTRNFFEAEMPDFGPVFAVYSNPIESMPQRQELIHNATHLENFDCARLDTDGARFIDAICGGIYYPEAQSLKTESSRHTQSDRACTDDQRVEICLHQFLFPRFVCEPITGCAKPVRRSAFGVPRSMPSPTCPTLFLLLLV